MRTYDMTVFVVVIGVVTECLNVTAEEIESRNRSWRVVWARWCVVRLLYEKTELSHSAIGRLLDREHTTIAHAIKGWKDTVETSAEARDQWNKIWWKLVLQLKNITDYRERFSVALSKQKPRWN